MFSRDGYTEEIVSDNGPQLIKTEFQHANNMRATWISPDGGTMNQINYILVHRKLKGRLKSFRTYRSAELGTDHFLVIANDVKHCVSRSHRKVLKRYDVDKLCDRETKQEFQVKIGGAFEHWNLVIVQWRNSG